MAASKPATKKPAKDVDVKAEGKPAQSLQYHDTVRRILVTAINEIDKRADMYRQDLSRIVREADMAIQGAARKDSE